MTVIDRKDYHVPTWLVLTFYGGLAVLQLGVGVAHASSPRVHVVGSSPLDSLGLLAIGSSSAEHFKSSMDTLFISFVGDVLARVLLPLLGADAARQSA